MSLGRTARRLATLTRWLGPWTDEHARPDTVCRRTLSVSAPDVDGDGQRNGSGRRTRRFDAWLYAPVRKPVCGAYAIAPGVHFEGPSDPRMDRFCRILAASGYLVISPFIADYMRLIISRQAIVDFHATVEALREDRAFSAGLELRLFSISFGSLLAISVAASPALRAHVERVVLFGGYADWQEVMRFCLTGEGAEHFDPLNRPVVFMNLLDAVLACGGYSSTHKSSLLDAWLTFVQRTWSRAGKKRDREFEPVARQLVRTVPEPVRHLYLMGCGVEDGGVALCERALAVFDGTHMEVRSLLPDVRCPVHIAHGADDDVIPVSQARELDAAMPVGLPHAMYITGLYGHTAQANMLDVVPALGREVTTLARLVYAIGGP